MQYRCEFVVVVDEIAEIGLSSALMDLVCMAVGVGVAVIGGGMRAASAAVVNVPLLLFLVCCKWRGAMRGMLSLANVLSIDDVRVGVAGVCAIYIQKREEHISLTGVLLTRSCDDR